MTEIKYFYFENVTTEGIARKAFDPVAKMLPGWVLECGVYACSTLSEDALLECNVDMTYRRLTFQVPGIFYDIEEEDRPKRVLHELVHGLLGELTEFVSNRILPVKIGDKPEGKLDEFLRAEFRQRVERVTEEMVFLLLPHYGQEWGHEEPMTHKWLMNATEILNRALVPSPEQQATQGDSEDAVP